jgi:hypothetical protein
MTACHNARRHAIGPWHSPGSLRAHLIVPLLSIRADAETRRLLEEAERRFPTFPRVQMLFSMLELFEGQWTGRCLGRKSWSRAIPKMRK